MITQRQSLMGAAIMNKVERKEQAGEDPSAWPGSGGKPTFPT